MYTCTRVNLSGDVVMLSVSMSADKDSAHILRPVIKTFQQLLVDMVSGEEEEEHSPEDKHLLSIVISALSLLTTHLSPDNPYTIKVFIHTSLIFVSFLG